MTLELLNVGAAIASTLITAVAAVILKRGERVAKVTINETGVGIPDAIETPEERKRRHLRKRMFEVEQAIEHYTSEASVNRWSNNLLVGGQYVVGGLLASSFIQQSLPPQLVGVMGLVVLGATIVHQRYRPDVKYRITREKISLLRSTLRRSQDQLAAFADPDISKIINALSQALSKVDDDEEWEIEEAEAITSHEKTEKLRSRNLSKNDPNILKIEKAEYGARNNYFDVTDELQAQIKNNRLETTVGDHIKGDPIKGVPKELIVSYWFNGERHSKTVKQDEILVLP